MIDDLTIFAKAQQQIEQDIDDRIKEHRAKVTNFEKNARVAGARSQLPYTAVAVGDSWFDYPLFNDIAGGNMDVIAQLEHLHGHEKFILRLAHHGDATTDMMSAPKQQRLIKALSDKSLWIKGRPNAIFCSAGGNDVAGNQFANFLNFNEGQPPSQGLNLPKFRKILGTVEANYLTLLELRDRYAPGVRVYAHTYDFPTPDGKHPLCAGPWLKPSLDSRRWSVPEGKVIITDALKRFRTMLKRLANDSANKFSVIDTQGMFTDPNYRNDWVNELHPRDTGFKRIAAKFDPFWMRMLQEDGDLEALPMG